MGQTIKGLDLALPFACEHMFMPLLKARQNWDPTTEQELPDLPETPVNTLPQRLMAAGYRYRRLIFNGHCRGLEAWDKMEALAKHQRAMISWELLYNHHVDSKAVWLVSGCAPVEFSVEGAMQHPFHEH